MVHTQRTLLNIRFYMWLVSEQNLSHIYIITLCFPHYENLLFPHYIQWLEERDWWLFFKISTVVLSPLFLTNWVYITDAVYHMQYAHGSNMMTSSNGNISPVAGHLCGEFTGHRRIPRTMFSLICTWINGWVNNGEAGDLRRHRAHYDLIVMICFVLVWYRSILLMSSRVPFIQLPLLWRHN